MAESTFLVVATSGRAIAQGLRALGYTVVVVDGFIDQDTVSAASACKKVKRTSFGLDAYEVERVIQELRTEWTFSGLLYDAAIEVCPRVLEFVSDLNIVGNSSGSLQRCKDPHQFFPALDKYAINYPEICFNSKPKDTKNWLCKQHHSTGGFGVTSVAIDACDEGQNYLQKNIDGVSFSLTFLANGFDIHVLGANTQWSERLSDAIPYAYAGAINQVKLDDEAIKIAEQHAKTITNEFELVGLNSIDCIYCDNNVYVLEVNPRIPASYELYETKYGDVMRGHITACSKRRLPAEKRQSLLRAHALVYAPHDILIPEDFSWPLWTADRPQNGEKIKQYEPICNVFSGGKNYSQVCEMITTRKKTVLNKLTT